MAEATTETTKAVRVAKKGDKVHLVKPAYGAEGKARFAPHHVDAEVTATYEDGTVDLAIPSTKIKTPLVLEKSPHDPSGQAFDSWHFPEA